MNEDKSEDSRDVECATNLRAFHDIRTWCRAVKPWPEFFRPSQFSILSTKDGYVKKMKKNFNKFMANYVLISVVLMICTIITSLWLLIPSILLGILVYIIYTKTKHGLIRIGAEEIPNWILYVAAIFITLPLFIYAGVGYILYCAMGISIILILIHALLYNNETNVLPDINVEGIGEGNSNVTAIDSTKRVLFRDVENDY